MPLLATYASASGRNYGARLSSPVPTFTVASLGAVTSINEGSSISFVVTSANATDGVYYWTINNITTANADFSSISGSFTITNNSGTFSVPVSADLSTEGEQTFSVSVRVNDTTDTIVTTSSTIAINDTSTDPILFMSPGFGGTSALTLTSGATVAESGCGTWTVTPNANFSARIKIVGRRWWC